MKLRGVVFAGIILMILLGMVFAFPKYSVKISSELESRVITAQETTDVIIKVKDKSFLQTFSEGKGKQNEYKNYIQKKVTLRELEELKRSPLIEEISLSHNISLFLEETVVIINSTKSNRVEINNTYNLTGTGETVCIIDTGVDFTHPDLAGKNNSCVVNCYNQACAEDCSIGDDHGHGTHVAGIVAASGGISGIATNASLIGIKVLNSAGGGSGTPELDLQRAIDYCTEQNVSVITMSLGTSTLYSTSCDSTMPTWRAAVDAAVAENISVIAASGNDANSTHISSPGCLSNVTAVGDTYDANVGSKSWCHPILGCGTALCTDATTELDQIVCHANRGNLVKLFAPGSVINSTKLGGGYEEQSGTSMATPVVAGAMAVMKQYLALTGKTKTPSELEAIFNNTGKVIYDSESGRNYTRIDIFEALLSIDETPPNVTLVSPIDGLSNYTNSEDFTCNFSDEFGLKNATAYLWNDSGELVNTSSVNLTGKTNSSSFTFPLESKTYTWNCEAYNLANNSAFAFSNFTFYSSNISVELLSPDNNTGTNLNLTNFTCQSVTSSEFVLSNISFYLWNESGGAIYNSSKNIIGNSNSSIFSYNLSLEGNYFWNCISLNNNSQSSWSLENYSLVFDTFKPNLIINSPTEDLSYTASSQEVIFSYNVSDNSEITNCSLIINDVINETNSNLENNSQNNFTKTFETGTFTWKISCYDKSGNNNESLGNIFSITAPIIVVQTSSSGGGGASYSTYTISYGDFSSGYSKNLREEDRIKFNVKMNEQHTLVINSISTNFANITISSNPVNFVLIIGESKKINLTSSLYYDTYVKLENITNFKANITIKEIYEPIKKTISIENETENNGIFETNEEKQEKNYFLEIILIGVILITIEILIERARRNRKKKNESTKTNSKRKKAISSS